MQPQIAHRLPPYLGLPQHADLPAHPAIHPPMAAACSLLLLGFVFPTWYVWTSELRLRTAMVEQQRAADAAHGGRPAGAPPLPSPHHMPTLAEYAMFAVPAVAAMFTFAVA